MKSVLHSFLLMLLVLVGFAFAENPDIRIVYITFVFAEFMLAEWSTSRKQRYGNSQSREWLLAQHHQNLIQESGTTAVMIAILLMFIPWTEQAGLAIVGVIAIIIYTYIVVPYGKPPEWRGRFPMVGNQPVHVREYRLKPWWRLPKALRKSINDLEYGHALIQGKPHLFAQRGIFVTSLRIITIGNTTEPKALTALVATLQEFPNRERKGSWQENRLVFQKS